MFFSASKVIWFLITPSNLLLVVLLAGTLMLRTGFSPLGQKLVAVSLIMLLVAGLSPLGSILLAPLENRFPQWTASQRSPAGIIVLGSGQEASLALRMTEAVMLARRYPLAKLVFTGGNGSLFGRGRIEADDAQNILVKLGVPSSQTVIERASRNTYENAGLVAKAVQPKPGETWLLVTSASHMPRAVGAFRKAGIYVTPYPVDFRTRGWWDALSFTDSVSLGLDRTDDAVREWVGLISYRAMGYTDTLFPGP